MAHFHRAGFYAENILLYAEQAKTTGKLPLPLGAGNKFAPVALGDVAQVAAYVLTGEGPHGFSDEHRGQLMVVTGPLLMAGDDLADVASKSLGMKLQYEEISEYVSSWTSKNYRILNLFQERSQETSRHTGQSLGSREGIRSRTLFACSRGQDELRCHDCVPPSHWRSCNRALRVL